MNGETKYAAGQVKCDICGYEWTAVRPLATGTLECPHCGNNGNFTILENESRRTP